MSISRRGPRRLLALAAIAVSIAALLQGAAVQAAAEPRPDGQVAEPFNATMGSQIRRVEGDQSTPESKEAAQKPQGVDANGVQIQATVAGIDVASYQGNVDWAYWWGQGKRFVWTKATEGTYYTNPYFPQQYNGSYNQGFIRGAYHFAIPNGSTGAAQADYFLAHGGGWSDDGKTLPGALDMEYNPYGATCYGLSQSAMGAWVRSFHDRYFARTGRWPIIYTSTNWWNQCVGSTQNFGETVPLWVARYSSSVGTLPYGWGFHTVWQYSSSPIDQDTFNGAYDRLQALAFG